MPLRLQAAALAAPARVDGLPFSPLEPQKLFGGGSEKELHVCQDCLAAAQGFGLGASLIGAIGAQNIFVLRQALMRRHVLPVALFCAMTDAVLVIAGALGLGALVKDTRIGLFVIALGGAAFLFWYGAKALRRALAPSALTAEENGPTDLRGTLLTVAAVSWLNPHVYLDTVVLLGGISASYPAGRQVWFVIGVIAASFSWFFALGYGGRALAPLFRKPAAWRIFDLGVAAIMWLIAARLVLLALTL
jgi:L-lysine exporter family protein LysE/ArgO